MTAAVTLSGAIAVDGFRKKTSCDCDFLCCAADRFSAPGKYATLRAMVEAFVAVDPAIRALGVNIVGHGAEGMISTGEARFNHGDPYISVHEPESWEPLRQLTRLPGGMPPLTLLGCWTGAGDDGRDLLNLLATELGTTVRAPSGVIACGQRGVVFVDGAGWNTATPTAPAHSRSKPSAQSIEGDPVVHEGWNWFMPGLTVQVTGVDEHAPAAPPPPPVKLLGLRTPIELGSVAATQTGTITIQTQLGERRLRVVGDDLLNDEEFCTVWYRPSPAFRTWLRDARQF